MTPAQPSSAAPHRDPALEGLRALAVLLVYLFHYGGGLRSTHLPVRLFGHLTASGWIGVHIFFALSGFLITGIVWTSKGQPHWLRNFYARRILRIVPLYFVVLMLCAVFTIAMGHSFHQLRMFCLFAFFLQDLPKFGAAAQQIPTLPLYHFWSLAVEAQFYLLLPFLLTLTRTRRGALRLCLATFLLSIAFCDAIFGLRHVFSGSTAQSFNSFLLTHAGPLALGSALAILLREPENSPQCSAVQRFALPAFLLGLAVYIASSLYAHTFTLAPRSQFVFGLPGVALAAAALIPLALRPGFLRRLCSHPALRFLGRISYGFYVFHVLLQPVFNAIGRHIAHNELSPVYFASRLLLALPITIAVSWLSYELLELPFLHLKRFFPTHPAVPANEPAA